jgi:hypothetical protein
VSPQPVSLPAPETEVEQPPLPSKPIPNPGPASANDNVQRSASVDIPRGSSNGVSSDQALEAALQEQVRAEADFHEQAEGEEMDIDDLYAAEPAQLAGDSIPSEKAIVQHSSVNADTQAEAEDEEAPLSHLPNLQPDSAIGADTDQDDENDDYEPPDATPPVDVVESPPFSPAPPESVANFERFSNDRRRPVEDNDIEELQVNSSLPIEVKYS